MFIKNQLSSILLTTTLAITASFANYPNQTDGLDAAPQRAIPAFQAPAIPPLLITSPHVLREIKSTFAQLQSGETKYQETEAHLQQRFLHARQVNNTSFSRTLFDKKFRVPVLKRKFQHDAQKILKKKQSELHKLIQVENFDSDIATQVLSSLRGYAAEIDYNQVSRTYQTSYVEAMLALDPVREDQHRKFQIYGQRFANVLSSTTVMSDSAFDTAKKALESWNPAIDASKVNSTGCAFKEAQTDILAVHKSLNLELQDLLEAARQKQKQRRSALSSNRFLDKLKARGRKSMEALYWGTMGTLFDLRLNA